MPCLRGLGEYRRPVHGSTMLPGGAQWPKTATNYARTPPYSAIVCPSSAERVEKLQAPRFTSLL